MKPYPDKEHTLALLADWAMHHTSVQAMMDGIEASIGLDINGPLFDTVWGLFEAYTTTIAVEVGDLGEWLTWYCNDNEMGAGGKQAGYDNKLKRIKTLTNLYELIAESHALELKGKE